MQIDPKYFNTFLAIVALIGAILIAFFTINSRQNDKAAFKEKMLTQDSLKTVYWPSFEASDSIRIADFRGKFVVVDFWASWSDASLNSQKELAIIKREYADTLQVIAASVGHSAQKVKSYAQKHKFPFLFVNGSRQFSEFHIPGIPAQLVYGPDGDLKSVFLGYADDSQYDSLRTIINGKK